MAVEAAFSVKLQVAFGAGRGGAGNDDLYLARRWPGKQRDAKVVNPWCKAGRVNDLDRITAQIVGFGSGKDLRAALVGQIDIKIRGGSSSSGGGPGIVPLHYDRFGAARDLNRNVASLYRRRTRGPYIFFGVISVIASGAEVTHAIGNNLIYGLCDWPFLVVQLIRI